MSAEHFAQRLVHQVRDRVVASHGGARFLRDLRREHVAHLHRAFLHMRHVAEDAFLDAIGFRDSQERRAVFKHAGVAHLAAHFRVEGGLVQNDDHVVARRAFLNLHAALVEGEHLGIGFGKGVVALKDVVFARVENVRRNLELTRGARLCFLLGHGAVKPFSVHREALFAAHVARQVNGEAVGVVQLEGNVAVQHAVLRFRDGGFKDLHAV